MSEDAVALPVLVDVGVGVDESAIDFAVAAYLDDEGRWTVGPLPDDAATDIRDLVTALRSQPAPFGALGLVSVADDFWILLRCRGLLVQLVLSDGTAADEWPIAQEALDLLDDRGVLIDDDAGPVGDLDVLADLGVRPAELLAVCADVDAYPDEQLGTVAARLGFGAEFDRVVDGLL